MYCSKCGNRVIDSAIFCPKCGVKLETSKILSESEEVSEKSIIHEKNQSDLGVKIHEQTLYNDESNTCEDRKKADADIKFKNKPKKLGLGACGIVAIIFIAFMLFGGRNPISDTKRIIFEQYGTISLGEATDRYLEEVDWESEKINDNEYKVTLQAFSNEVAFRFLVEFRVTYVDDRVYAIPRAVSIAGEEYTDDMSLWEIMSIIYGKSIEEADEAYWEGFW